MPVGNALRQFVKIVVDEAARNPKFAEELESAFAAATLRQSASSKDAPERLDGDVKRPRGRRNKAVLDPVHLARDGEERLRTALEKLNVDELKDIVAEFGMDPRRKVMRWKTREKIVEEIVRVSTGRSRKGESFL